MSAASPSTLATFSFSATTPSVSTSLSASDRTESDSSSALTRADAESLLIWLAFPDASDATFWASRATCRARSAEVPAPFMATLTISDMIALFRRYCICQDRIMESCLIATIGNLPGLLGFGLGLPDHVLDRRDVLHGLGRRLLVLRDPVLEVWGRGACTLKQRCSSHHTPAHPTTNGGMQNGSSVGYRYTMHMYTFVSSVGAY